MIRIRKMDENWETTRVGKQMAIYVLHDWRG